MGSAIDTPYQKQRQSKQQHDEPDAHHNASNAPDWHTDAIAGQYHQRKQTPPSSTCLERCVEMSDNWIVVLASKDLLLPRALEHDHKGSAALALAAATKWTTSQLFLCLALFGCAGRLVDAKLAANIGCHPAGDPDEEWRQWHVADSELLQLLLLFLLLLLLFGPLLLLPLLLLGRWRDRRRQNFKEI